MVVKLAILLAVVLIVAAFVAWAFLPARYLPGNRARHLRIGLHLRLHPGKGFAHVFSLWLRWSRFAALRRLVGQARPRTHPRTARRRRPRPPPRQRRELVRRRRPGLRPARHPRLPAQDPLPARHRHRRRSPAAANSAAGPGTT